MQRRSLVSAVLMIGVLMGAGSAMSADSPQKRRDDIQAMRSAVLEQLHRLKPDTKSQIAAGTGYAVFKTKGVDALLVSLGRGHGVVHDNATGRDTYMKMDELGVGPGLGARDYRVVFVFHSSDALRKFVEKGWEFGGHADAAAKSGGKGGAVSGEVLVDKNITVYEITEKGLSLAATLRGIKYSKDAELND